MHKVNGYESYLSPKKELLRSLSPKKVAFDRELSDMSNQELLEPKAQILRARQYAPIVSSSGLIKADPSVRLGIARTHEPLGVAQRCNISDSMRHIMQSYDYDFFSEPFEVPVDEVVFDISPNRQNATVSCKLAAHDRLKGERLVFADALQTGDIDVRYISNGHADVLVPIGKLHFENGILGENGARKGPLSDSEMEELFAGEFGEFMSIVDESAPAQVSFDPII